MIRTPDVPTRPKKEFDPEEFEKEKEWLERKQQGLIFSSTTPGGWILVFGTAFIISLVIGGMIGALLGVIFHNIVFLIVIPGIVYGIAIYFMSGDYATVEIDPERELMLYHGAIMLGGEYHATRYRGPIQVVLATHLVRFKHRFGLKSRPFIRFVTKSGYLRVKYDPENEYEFLEALEKVGLCNLREMEKALDREVVVKETDQYLVHYLKEFDRTEFFEELKRQKEQEEHQKQIEKRIRRQQLIEKSKKFKAEE